MILVPFLDELNSVRLLEGVKLSQREYKALMADPNLIAGFESEFEVPERDADLDYLADRFENTLEVQVYPIYEITKDTGESVPFKKRTDRWYIEREGSADHDLQGWGVPDSWYGMELVSPPLQLAETLRYMDTAFDTIHNLGFDTTDSTGLHVGMSYRSPEYTKANLDPVKLAFLLGEQDIIRQFGREGNIYTVPQLQKLADYVGSNYDEFARNERDINALLQDLFQGISWDKYTTFNYGRVQQSGYVEYRIIGGKDYHRRFSEIEQNVMRYALVLKAGVDPQAFRQEYLKKVYKFVQEMLNQRTDPEARTSPGPKIPGPPPPTQGYPAQISA